MRIEKILFVSALAAIAASFSARSAFAEGMKNLQVLPKTTTKEQIKEIMRGQAKALDVECDFCHDVPDMASDAKPEKKAARQMMKMTADINERWLKGMKDAEKNSVTCGTCHRGKNVPPPFVVPPR